MAKAHKTDAEIIEALQATQGRQSIAAKRLGITRKTIANRAKKSKKIADEIWEQNELVLDLAEGSLIRAVADREPWAVCFTLKTKGKHRGYSEKLELDTGNKPLVQQNVLNQQINLTDPMRMAEMIGALVDTGMFPKELAAMLMNHSSGTEPIALNGTG